MRNVRIGMVLALVAGVLSWLVPASTEAEAPSPRAVLDSTFGEFGEVVALSGEGSPRSAVRSDGGSYLYEPRLLAVRSYDPDGQQVGSFGAAGELAMDPPREIAVDSVGRLIAMRLLPPAGDRSWTVQVERYLNNGDSDGGFGDQGVALVETGERFVGGLLVSPDDEIAFRSGNLWKLTDAGQLDSSFGTGGSLSVGGPVYGNPSLDAFFVLRYASDGSAFDIDRYGFDSAFEIGFERVATGLDVTRVFVNRAGRVVVTDGGDFGDNLWVFDADGTLNASATSRFDGGTPVGSYGVSGFLISQNDSVSEERVIRAFDDSDVIATEFADGGTLYASSAGVHEVSDGSWRLMDSNRVRRFQPGETASPVLGGDLDTLFGVAGRVPASNTNGFVTTRSFVPHEDGSLVEIDFRFASGVPALTARRLDENGIVDPSFGSGGTISFGEHRLGSDGLTPVTGRSGTTWVPLVDRFGSGAGGLARVTSTGFDQTWGDGGVLSVDATQPFTRGDASVRLRGFRELQDGSVLLNLANNSLSYAVRLAPDGSLDTSWAQDGFLTARFRQAQIRFGSDGSAIELTTTTASPFVRRFTPDGLLDASFQTPTFVGASDRAEFRFHELSDGSLLVAVRDDPLFVLPISFWTVNVFRPDGSTIEPLTGRLVYDLTTIVPDDEGGYIVVADAGSGSAVQRIGRDGEIDSTFFGDGSAEATLGGFRLRATSPAYRDGAIWFAWAADDRRAWISRIGAPSSNPGEPAAPPIGAESLPGLDPVRSAAMTRNGEAVLFIDAGDDVDRFDGDVSSPDDWQILNVGDLNGEEFVAVAAAERVRDVAVATVSGGSSEWDELQVRTEVNGEFQLAHSTWLDFLDSRQRAEFSNDGDRLVYTAIVDADAPVSQQSDIRDDDLENGEDLETDVYVWNDETDRFRRLTVDFELDGAVTSFSTFDSYDADISGDGEWVAFISDLDVGDIESADVDPDVFVRRWDGSGVPLRISRDPDGNEAAPLAGSLRQHSPALSDDGRFVAYATNASGLDGEVNSAVAVMVHDRDSDGELPFDEPGETTMTQVNGFDLAEVHSLDIDGEGLTVSITYTLPNGQHEWALYRRPTQTSSFAASARQFRSLESEADSETDLSRDGKTVMVRDGADLYQIDISGFGSNLPLFAETQGRTPTRTRPVVSDPVNTATGALVASVVDLPAPAGAPLLSWERSYDSQRIGSSALGRGWRSSWDVAIDARRTDPVFVNEHGGEYTFVADGAGRYTRPDEILADLRATPTGLELAWFSGETWRFDDFGRLEERRAWDGTGVVATRSETGTLERLDASTGPSLLLDYDSTTGELTTVSMSDGRTAAYGYDGGNLTVVAIPAGEMEYAYDGLDRLVAETDAAGVVVHTTDYASDGRVIRQEMATGEVTLFVYDDELRTTTVTDVESGDVVVYAFDEAARLTSITDPDGNVTLSEWSPDGQPAGSTDRLGHSPSAVYDSNGNLTSVTDPVSGTTAYTYDGDNRVTSVVEPTGAVTSMTYDGSERIPSTVTDGLGNVTTFTVEDGLVSSVVDADGVATSYVYDGLRRMVEMTNGLGFSWSYEYDAVGRQTGSTTPLGFATSRTFDDAGRMLTSTAADGGVTSYVYDADGRVLSTTDPVGAVTSNTYDEVTGLLAMTTDPEGRVTTYTYNELSELVAVEANDGGVSETDYGTLGRVTATRDPLGRETTYAYDANGNRTEVVAPDGGVTRTEFDTAGRISALEDPIGRRTTHAYDEFGRLVSVTQPDGTEMSYTYDLLGRQIETIAPDGGVTATAFTPAGRMASVTDPENGVTSYAYDAAGQMDAVTDPNGFVTSFDYDPDGRRTAVITPEGLVTSWEYDPVGRIINIIDPAGVELSRTYTLRGELETEQREGDGVVQYSYNADGSIASVADAMGNTTTFTYDAAGRQETRVDATGAVEVWEYNPAGELLAQVDRLGQRTEITYDANGRIDTVNDPSGRTTDHGYDVAGQLLDRAFGDGTTISYSYDELGRRTQMVDATGVTTYGYDDNGRPIEVAAPNGTLGYTYDQAGRRTGLTYPDGTTVTYDYDIAGRLVGLTDPNTGDVEYTLDDDGRLTLTELPNGETRSFKFVNGRMVRHQDHGRVTELTYDESGRIATLSGAQNHTYTYDQAGQLLEAVQDEGTYAYTYGTRGEITSITDPERTRSFTHNANGEISTIVDGGGEAGSVVYDEAGRMVEHVDPSGEVTTYTYDARGLLVETVITTPGDGGGGADPDPCEGLVPTITGTDGDDVIQGTWQDDIIFGLGGNDTINGASGADIICGGDGDDIINGDSQDDTMHGGSGDDTINGNSGADTITGGVGNDTLNGDSQDDTINGGSGDDQINGGPGNDMLDGGNDDDVVDGSWQTDTCDDAEQAISCETITTNGETNQGGGAGSPILCNGLVATIVGTDGGDILQGTWRDDVIVGLAGNDTINGASGADTICGGDGDDIIHGNSQNDTIAGEAGDDTIAGDSGADIIDGGPGNDTITGDSQNDQIQGGDGNDTINGGSGGDTLDGGNDTDTIDGSWQTDACDGEVEESCESQPGSPLSGLDGTLRTDQTSSTAITEQRSYTGDGLLSAVGDQPGLLWDPTLVVPTLVHFGIEQSGVIYGRTREIDRGTVTSMTALRDHVPDDVSTEAGPFGALEPHQNLRFGYRGGLETSSGVHLVMRDLNPSLGQFSSTDPLGGVIGTTVLTNPFHYADNEPIAHVDPLGLRTVDAGITAEEWRDFFGPDVPYAFRGTVRGSAPGTSLEGHHAWPVFMGGEREISAFEKAWIPADVHRGRGGLHSELRDFLRSRYNVTNAEMGSARSWASSYNQAETWVMLTDFYTDGPGKRYDVAAKNFRFRYPLPDVTRTVKSAGTFRAAVRVVDLEGRMGLTRLRFENVGGRLKRAGSRVAAVVDVLGLPYDIYQLGKWDDYADAVRDIEDLGFDCWAFAETNGEEGIQLPQPDDFVVLWNADTPLYNDTSYAACTV